ncbi:MAG: transporter related protein [Betaproteobacteria bacterium]|nr:transporter related protein [Betaproteobacteria bacterium]
MDDALMRVATAQRSKAGQAAEIRVTGMTKHFGGFTALDDVSMTAAAGSFHALLGENGAGKSTLVKCLVGFYKPDAGQIEVDSREQRIASPHDSSALGIGMVYQHFTLVPSMTIAENLVMARSDVPRIINWRRERERLAEFMRAMPLKVPLDQPAARLAAGDKQKAEILKQLFLERRFLILDEPTSVLTPGEADQVLGLLKEMAGRKQVTVLMITHKFREVNAFCDEVTVLRRGRLAGAGRVAELDAARMAEMMVGERVIPAASGGARPATSPTAAPMLEISDLRVENESGVMAVNRLSVAVRPGEIVGLAGVAGNGQRELVEALLGQRRPVSGGIRVASRPYTAKRADIGLLRVSGLPEEPLRNACVAAMSVAENMALRNFDRAPLARSALVSRGPMLEQARSRIAAFNVKSRGAHAPIGTLSGGNVQRAVLARELSDPVLLLIAADPVFGLDFAAVAEIHDRILAARNAGTAVLLVSSDLDELLGLADRIAVIFEGRIVHETAIGSADIGVIGRALAGHAAQAA